MVLKFEGDALSRLYSSMLNAITYQSSNSVLTGCEVTEQAVPAMAVDFDDGRVFFSIDLVDVTAGSVVIAANSTTNDRIDLIVVNTSGVVSVVQGTPALLPLAPDYNPDNFIILAQIDVVSSASTIVDADIRDLRVLNTGGVSGGDGSIGRFKEEFTAQTSVSVVHNLGDSLPVVIVYDNTVEVVQPDTITIVDENEITVTFSASTTGTIVVYGGAGSATSYYTKEFTSSATWNVAHNLGQQYVAVHAYNGSNVEIAPSTVTLTDANNLVVTFGGATAGRVVVVGGSSERVNPLLVPISAINALDNQMFLDSADSIAKIKDNNSVIQQLNSNVFDVEAGETVAVGEVGFIYMSGHANAGEAWLSDANVQDKNRATGIFVKAGNNGDTVQLMTRGVFTTTGLTAKETYYLSATAGALTTTPSGVRIGHAISTTQLYIDIVQDDRDTLGTIKSYLGDHAGMIANPLTAFWKLMDGTVINDAESPLNFAGAGEAPDTNTTQRIIRGGATSDDGTDNTATGANSHSHTANASADTAGAQGAGVGGTNTIVTHTHPTSSVSSLQPLIDATFIMKIK